MQYTPGAAHFIIIKFIGKWISGFSKKNNHECHYCHKMYNLALTMLPWWHVASFSSNQCRHQPHLIWSYTASLTYFNHFDWIFSIPVHKMLLKRIIPTAIRILWEGSTLNYPSWRQGQMITKRFSDVKPGTGATGPREAGTGAFHTRTSLPTWAQVYFFVKLQLFHLLFCANI